MKHKTVLLIILVISIMMMTLNVVAAAPSAQTEEGQEYVVQADDWLSKLADKFYGDIFAWPVIFEATNAKAAEDASFAVIENPDLIEIGQKLWIPAATPDTGQVTTPDVSIPTSYAIPGEAVFPEGIAYNPANGKFYVGSTTDGTLYEGNVAGGDMTVFSEGGADGRTTAIGLKVDGDGRLWVSGGGTGQMFVYDTAERSFIANYTTPEADQTFINDVTITPNGDAYFTDSFRPFLFKISGTEGGPIEPWLDFTGTALEYVQGFNLNGIAATSNGSYLITVHSGKGELYRIDTSSQEVIKIDLGEGTVTAGDGIWLAGNTLYVSRNQFGEIAPVELSDDFSTGVVGTAFTDPSLIFPTTIALVDNTLLVVNSQFNNRQGTPKLPFSVSRIPLPKW